MNNDENRRLFLSAQNRVAIMLFCMAIMQIVASTLISEIFNAAGATGGTLELLESMLMYILYLGVPILIFPLLSKKPLKKYISLKPRSRKDGSKLSFKEGAAAVALALGIMYFGQIFSWLMTELFGTFGISLSPESETVYSGAAAYIIMLVSTAVLPAIFEEILARGIILGELLPYGKSVAIIYSGMMFGLMHMNPVQLPFACISGIVVAYFTVESGSLWIGIIAHFLNNGLSVAGEIMSNELSDGAYSTVSAVIEITIFTLAILSAVYIFARRRSLKATEPVTEKTPLCAVTTEQNRVDITSGLFTNMSAVMILYVLFAVLCSLAVLVLYNITL